MTQLSQRMNWKISSRVESSWTLNELRKLPMASEVNNAKTHNELARNISYLGNHSLTNFGAALKRKQKPKELITVPKKKKK